MVVVSNIFLYILKIFTYTFLSSIFICKLKDTEFSQLLKIQGEGSKGHLVNLN